ncbi:hypothetical protein ACJJTC_009784 [Scirpophaga incertulas]
MASKTGFELHHNFPKIADEAGFSFKVHRHRIHIDWNKIRHIDIEILIRERKFFLIEQHLNDILDCILESEFDVRILDEGVLKMFRLAQLAIEYQQFCRHYLDRSVYVLRGEINSLAQELEVTKKELKDREEEIRRLKRKTKHSYRTPLPYGNDNIATMILKTLTGKNDFFSASLTGDSLQYNKCRFCEKVFMNQLYLKNHISRRHSHIIEAPEKDVNESIPQPHNSNNNKLSDEILELKLKLQEMENVMKTVNKQECFEVTNQNVLNNTEEISNKLMKDAEVCTNEEINVLDKIEEWKREEDEKHKKEINTLRLQIIETINSLKEKDTPTLQLTHKNEERQIIEELNSTINKQGAEILSLKQELIESRMQKEKEQAERRNESALQMMEWTNRAEVQTKQYESMVQKLNEMAKEARESRAQAEAEKQRVEQLEHMLKKSLSEKSIYDTNNRHSDINTNTVYRNPKQAAKNIEPKRKSSPKTPNDANRQVLEKLHQKAQALLELGSSNSSSLESSSVDNNIPKIKNDHTDKDNKNHISKQDKKTTMLKNGKNAIPQIIKTKTNINGIVKKPSKKEKTQIKSSSLKNEKNGIILNHGSPLKLVRAKILEKVNDRLVSAGVDPLHKGIPKQNFQRQRNQLQQQVDIKTKKIPSYEKVRHSIVAYLDTKLPQNIQIPEEYVSPNKISKTFNLTSVISNMKSKALSLVKLNEDNQIKEKRKLLRSELSKRAMSLINTPPDSTHSSPKVEQTNIEQKKVRNDYFSEHKNRHDLVNEKLNERVPKNTYSETESEDDESKHKYYTAVIQETTKSIDTLIKSPARRPLSANSEYNMSKKYVIDKDNLLRSQSATVLANMEPDITIKQNTSNKSIDSSSTELSDNIPDEGTKLKDSNINNEKPSKGVLKNASSTSSLNKKKVLFDMDAIQMKSVSASPSQSITEKSDGNDKSELGLINLDGEEWDVSSIDNEPLENDTKLRLSTRASPKIAELKQTIESQLARRNETPSTAIIGGVDILRGPTLRASSVGGSNTSLGSSILDDSESPPPVISHKAFVKPKVIANKDDSELDISEFSDGIAVNKNDTF